MLGLTRVGNRLCLWKYATANPNMLALKELAPFPTLGKTIASALRLKDLQLTTLDCSFGFLEIQTVSPI